MNGPLSNVHTFINRLAGKNPKDGVIPTLQHNSILLTSNQQKAEAFSKYFEHPAPSKFPHLTPHVCKLHNKTKAKEEFLELFTERELLEALEEVNVDSASGEDEISYLMLTNSEPRFRKALIDVYNESWKQSTFPKIWKKSIITPVNKPNKPPERLSSYRPISLLPVLGKIMEKRIKKRL